MQKEDHPIFLWNRNLVTSSFRKNKEAHNDVRLRWSGSGLHGALPRLYNCCGNPYYSYLPMRATPRGHGSCPLVYGVRRFEWNCFKLVSYLEDHSMTCRWLGSPPFISHEVRPFGRGTALISGLTITIVAITTYPSPGARSSRVRMRVAPRMPMASELDVMSSWWRGFPSWGVAHPKTTWMSQEVTKWLVGGL